MTAATQPKAKAPPTLTAEQMAARTVVLLLERGGSSFRRSMSASELVDKSDTVDTTLLDVQKHLIDRKYRRAITTLDQSLEGYLRTREVPCSMLAARMWLLPLARVEEVDAVMVEYQERRTALVRELVREKYDDAKAEAKRRLKTHYREEEYPTPDEVEESYTVRVRWLSYNVPAALEEQNKEIAAREALKVQAEWARASDEILGALVESFLGLIRHLSDVLTEDAEGKPKTFRDSTVAKITDFLSTFADRNLTGNATLAGLAVQAQEVLKGVDPETLRKQGDARQRVLGGMKAIEAKLGEIEVVTPGVRRLARDEEV